MHGSARSCQNVTKPAWIQATVVLDACAPSCVYGQGRTAQTDTAIDTGFRQDSQADLVPRRVKARSSLAGGKARGF